MLVAWFISCWNIKIQPRLCRTPILSTFKIHCTLSLGTAACFRNRVVPVEVQKETAGWKTFESYHSWVTCHSCRKTWISQLLQKSKHHWLPGWNTSLRDSVMVCIYLADKISGWKSLLEWQQTHHERYKFTKLPSLHDLCYRLSTTVILYG
jgi:hypothetical protein